MATKKTTKKRASKTTTLRPYVYASGEVKLLDTEKYAKAVARSRSATGGQKEQAKRRKKSKEKVDKVILTALSKGERVNLSFLKRSGPVPGATERRTFSIEGGKSRSRLAKWLGEPKSENVKRFQRRLQISARVAEIDEAVSFNVQPNPGLKWAGEVGRWIEQTAILLLEGKPKKPTKRKRKGDPAKITPEPVPERRPPSDDTSGESSGTPGRRSDATIEPKPSEKRPVLILDISVMSDKEPTGEELDFEADDRNRKRGARRRKS